MIGLVHFGSITTDEEKEQQEFGIDFKKILTWTTNGPSNSFVDTDFENGTITLNRTGTYVIICSLSFKGTNERDYEISLFVNGIENKEIKMERYFGKNLVTGDMTAIGILQIGSVPAVLDLRAKCDKSNANVMMVENGSLTIFQVIPTA